MPGPVVRWATPGGAGSNQPATWKEFEMKRLCSAVIAGILAGLISGCGEGQPNHPAQPNEVTPDFAKNSADMMKNANAGMDPKKAKDLNKPAATP
jgi:hypothetical protein